MHVGQRNRRRFQPHLAPRPDGGATGDQPGMRPSKAVRCQRNCCCWTKPVFQRGRGRLRFSSAVSDRKTMVNSLSAANSCETSTR